MPVPISVTDGDFSIARQNGEWSYEYPFADQGDMVSFVATREMVIDAAAYSPPTAMQQFLFARQSGGTAYLVGIKGPEPFGNGLLKYYEVYASVPVKRTIYAPVVFTQPTIQSATLAQFTERVQGEYVYEYSINDPLPTILKTIFFQSPSGLYNATSGQQINPNSQQRVLVDDAISQIYKGRIYERLSIYANTRLVNSYTP